MRNLQNVRSVVLSSFSKDLKLEKICIYSETYNRDIDVYIKETKDYVLCINITTLNSYININREIYSYFTNRGIKYNLINIFFVATLDNIKDTYFQTEFYEEAIFIEETSGKIECFNVHSVGFLNMLKNTIEKCSFRSKIGKKNNHLTMFLILISISVYFIIATINGDIVSIRDEVLLWAGGKMDPLIESGEYIRIFISPFLHKNFIQLLVGVITLFFIGSIVEKNIGKMQYILLIILGIFFGNFASYLINFSNVFGVGLYVVNYTLIGALFILAFKYRSKVNKLFFVFIFSFIGLNLINSIFLNNIDNFGSLASFIVGLIFMKVIEVSKR